MQSTSRKRTAASPSPAAAPPPPAVWIGIDISKLTIDTALHPVPGAPALPTATFPRTKDGLAAMLAWARAHAPAGASLHPLMEATGRYSLEAAAWLVELDPTLRPVIVNPLQAKRFAQSHGRRNKTDSDDARMLARMGAERSPAAPGDDQAPRPVHRTLRALVRERRQLVEEKTRLKQRRSEGAELDFIVRQRKEQLDEVEARIEAFDQEIVRVVGEDAELAEDVRRLLTIPGVGFVTATTLLAELGDLRRFASGREIAAFAGVSPGRFESGTSVRGRTRMCKVGSPLVRAALFMAASTAARMKRGELRGMYDRLRGRGKAPKNAIGALMRKMLTIARALLVTQSDYRETENTPQTA